MSDQLTPGEILRRQAQAAKDKKNTRVKSSTLRVKIAAVLNDLTMENATHCEYWWSATKPVSQAVASLKKIIIEDGLEDFIFPIADDAQGCVLVKFNWTHPDEKDV